MKALLRFFEIFKKDEIWRMREICLGTSHIVKVLPAEWTVAELKLSGCSEALRELSDSVELCKVVFNEGQHTNSSMTIGSVEQFYNNLETK